MPTEHQKSREWVADHAKRIGETVIKLRGERSGLWLSNETAKAGHRISRTSIHDLESGTRKFVSTAELAVLAWALKVPPLRLLYPDLPDGPVEMIPGMDKPSIEAVMWWSGEVVYMPVGPDDPTQRWSDEELRETGEFWDGSALMRLSRERARLMSRIADLSKIIARMDKSLVPRMIEDVVSTQKSLESVLAELRQVDGAVVSDGG